MGHGTEETRPARLAYVEHALPGAGRTERRALARELGVALELAHRPGDELELAGADAATVVTLQAHGLHEAHALHPDARVRARGARHLVETIEVAARAGVPRVLAVAGFGHEPCPDPLARAVAMLRPAEARARTLGVRVLVEPLSPLRAGALAHPDAIERLLDLLAAPDVFALALDTGHLLDAGLDPAAVFARARHAVLEVQLRGRGSEPPGLDLPVEVWLEALPRPPAVVAVEHREPLAPSAVRSLIRGLRRRLDLA